MCGRRGEGPQQDRQGDGGTLEAHSGQRTGCGVVARQQTQGFNTRRGVASFSHGPDDSTSEAHRRFARNRGRHHPEAGFEDHGTTN